MVIPTFNSAPFIAEAIQSVQEQTYVNWEIVEVDGSTRMGLRKLSLNFI
jgi:glycosyltransferase involved in cell wall biosynthesis